MEQLTRAIEEKKASLDEQLTHELTAKETLKITFGYDTLERLSNSDPEFEDIRLCVRNINISEVSDLGEAYSNDAEIAHIDTLAKTYQTKAEELKNLENGEDTLKKHITASTCYDILNIILTQLETENAVNKSQNIHTHEPDGIVI